MNALSIVIYFLHLPAGLHFLHQTLSTSSNPQRKSCGQLRSMKIGSSSHNIYCSNQQPAPQDIARTLQAANPCFWDLQTGQWAGMVLWFSSGWSRSGRCFLPGMSNSCPTQYFLDRDKLGSNLESNLESNLDDLGKLQTILFPHAEHVARKWNPKSSQVDQVSPFPTREPCIVQLSRS